MFHAEEENKCDMTLVQKKAILDLLDWERQTVVYPGMARVSEGGIIRDLSADGKSGEIAYSSCSESEVERRIQHEILAARSGGYELEWKVYGHDQPHCLGERLTAVGFEAGDKEAFMVLLADSESLKRFGDISGDLRRVTSTEGLRDYQIVREEVSGKSCAKEIEGYSFLLENHSDRMSLYVAYVDCEPAACGRVYFHEESRFAALYGGQTRERFRQRGLFTQMVAVRLLEALNRGIVNICVDALPTSEPILRKRGFESLKHTQLYSLLG